MTTGRLHAHCTELSSSLRTVSVAPCDVRECIPRLTEHKLGHADRTVRSVVIHRACRLLVSLADPRAIPVPFLAARPTWSASPPRCTDVPHIEFSTQLGHTPPYPASPTNGRESHPKRGFPRHSASFDRSNPASVPTWSQTSHRRGTPASLSCARGLCPFVRKVQPRAHTERSARPRCMQTGNRLAAVHLVPASRNIDAPYRRSDCRNEGFPCRPR